MRSLRDLGTGVRCFLRGFGLVVRTPRLLALGALPAALTTLLYLAALVGLVFVVDDVVTWATPFADGWAPGARGLLRFVAGAAFVIGAVAVFVVTFAAVTLAIGGVFYDRIAAGVDRELGGVPEVGAQLGAGRELGDALRLLAVSLIRVVPMSLLGLIPVVGQSIVPVAVALTGAWFLTVELTGAAFGARGLDLAARRATLRRRPLLVVGFGLPAYVGCLVPVLAILVMPAAVAGATLLTRAAGDEPTTRPAE